MASFGSILLPKGNRLVCGYVLNSNMVQEYEHSLHQRKNEFQNMPSSNFAARKRNSGIQRNSAVRKSFTLVLLFLLYILISDLPLSRFMSHVHFVVENGSSCKLFFLLLTFAYVVRGSGHPVSHRRGAEYGIPQETATDFWPQAISMLASITAGVSTIVAAQLTKRFPIAFHSFTPRWKYTVWPLLGYVVTYIALILYGIIRRGTDTGVTRLSSTLAFMSAPGVPLHGFLWALIPQTKFPVGPPATETYLRQCFSRKPAILLIPTFLVLIGSAIASGIVGDWQGLALQIAVSVAFITTGRTPETMPEARESAFGRAGRYLLVPRPGRRKDTVAYGVDLEQERMLPPVRISMDGIDAYKDVSELTFGRAGRDSDDENTSETPVVSYLDLLVAKFRVERLGDMTGRLWRTLEAWKIQVHEPAKELPLMYGVVERMGYVAFRPGSCTTEERSISTSLNFVNCRADLERGRTELQGIAQQRMTEWREAGEALIQGESWERAHLAGANFVDKDVPAATEMISDDTWSDTQQRDSVETVGAMVCFVRSSFGHDREVMDPILNNLPFYFNRIKADLMEHGSIPAVCHGILFSMKKRGMLDGNVHGHEWAAAGEPLRWGGGGYAILDQAYARNSAIAYVGQLAVIVVKAVLES